jgi:hypothetical protein
MVMDALAICKPGFKKTENRSCRSPGLDITPVQLYVPADEMVYVSPSSVLAQSVPPSV